MSYAQRKEMAGNRTAAIVVVALIHLALGYAIVTGLAYNVIKKTAEDLKTFNVEEEPPPPEEEGVVLTFSPPVLDLGATKTSAVFTMTNIGDTTADWILTGYYEEGTSIDNPGPVPSGVVAAEVVGEAVPPDPDRVRYEEARRSRRRDAVQRRDRARPDGRRLRGRSARRIARLPPAGVGVAEDRSRRTARPAARPRAARHAASAKGV